jgi:hypothetical protein
MAHLHELLRAFLRLSKLSDKEHQMAKHESKKEEKKEEMKKKMKKHHGGKSMHK